MSNEIPYKLTPTEKGYQLIFDVLDVIKPVLDEINTAQIKTVLKMVSKNCAQRNTCFTCPYRLVGHDRCGIIGEPSQWKVDMTDDD